MLTGNRAFEGQSSAALLAAVMRDDPKPVNELKRDVPPEVRRIVTRCLKKDPAARYASGAELAQELKRLSRPAISGVRRKAKPGADCHERRNVPGCWFRSCWWSSCLAVRAGLAGEALPRRALGARGGCARDLATGRSGKIRRLPMRSRRKAEKSIPGDPALAKLWPLISYQTSLETTPPGVDVYRRDYATQTRPWELVGTTPLKNVRQPRGMFVWKFEKPGFGTVLRTTAALFGWYPAPPGRPVAASVTLDEAGKIPAGMVRVSPAKYSKTLFIPGYEGMPELALKDYWIDQYEVTNRQFKAFVDQGGYQKREYWKVDFQRDGKHLSWDEAMALFRDAAGRPGPKDWITRRISKGTG